MGIRVRLPRGKIFFGLFSLTSCYLKLFRSQFSDSGILTPYTTNFKCLSHKGFTMNESSAIKLKKNNECKMNASLVSIFTSN